MTIPIIGVAYLRDDLRFYPNLKNFSCRTIAKPSRDYIINKTLIVTPNLLQKNFFLLGNKLVA
jgi:hypothetical protein